MAYRIGDRVKETTSSIGTGAFTTAGAVNGFRTLASLLTVNGDTAYYGAVSGAQWETGLLTRVTATSYSRSVRESSNANLVVDFTTAPVLFLTIPAAVFSTQREVLVAARTYYVRPDGSDSNDGLANTVAGAFLTLQKAATVIERTLDLGGQAVTVQVADGTYTAGAELPNFTGVGTVTFLGNAATPANVLINTTSANCFTGSVQRVWTLNGFKVQTTTSGRGIQVLNGGVINFLNFDFGACASQHMAVTSAKVVATGDYTITGSTPNHITSAENSVIETNGRTITLVGTPAWGVSFIYARGNTTFLAFGSTYTGAATGQRYNITHNATIFTNGAAEPYLPGNAAGVAAFGATYG